MKVLIAGDNYAELVWKDNLKEYSWPFILEGKYKWTVDNVAKGGSGLAYTYLELKKSNLASYDKVVVVVTGSGRILHNYGAPHFYNLNSAEAFLKSLDTEKSLFPNLEKNIQKEAALAIINYYKHIYNPELDAIYYEAIFKKIIELVPPDKLILINGCCNDNIIKNWNWHFPVKLMDITAYEIEDLNITLPDSQSVWRETALHINHLSVENKHILAEEIKNLCENKSSSIAINDFKKITAEGLSLYYILRTETLTKQLDRRYFAKVIKKLQNKT
jgi:hypothetical protein